MQQNRRRHPLSPSGVAPARELGSASCWYVGDRLGCFELSALPEHSVHDDGETAGKRDARLSHGRPPTDVEGPILEGELAAIAGEHDIGRLVKQRADPSVAALRDAAGIVDLAGLVAPWHQAQIGPDVARPPEAFRFIDRRDEGERC